MSYTFQNKRCDRMSRYGFLVVLGVGCFVHLQAALHGNINLDEYQFIINGWDVFRGLAPYRDFWDNHGPAANYVFALPFFCFPATHEILTIFRLAAFVLTLLTAGLTAVVAVRSFMVLLLLI